MSTAPSDEPIPLAKAFRLAYILGLLLCLVWPLFLQLLLRTLIHPAERVPPQVAQQLGYTFSGLTFLIALFITWRWSKVRKGFSALPAQERPAVLLRETLLYAALAELTSLFGILYFALGGPLAERYGRSFIALSTIMFFVFVPRLGAWREAAQGE